MFLATNISIDKNAYKQMFLDEGFLFVKQDYLFSVIERYGNYLALRLMQKIVYFR